LWKSDSKKNPAQFVRVEVRLVDYIEYARQLQSNSHKSQYLIIMIIKRILDSDIFQNPDQFQNF